MESATAIVDWIASTHLRLFLDAVESQYESEQFVARLGDRVREHYPSQRDGKTLFPFKRTFVTAYR